MKAAAAVAGTAIGALLLFAFSRSAKASVKQPGGYDPVKDKTVHDELDKIKQIVDTAIASKNPATIRSAAAKLKNTNWVYPESEAQADKAAADLLAYAQALEDEMAVPRHQTGTPDDIIPPGWFNP